MSAPPTTVWCETHDTRQAAFTRERQIKKLNRDWTPAPTERDNPDWDNGLAELV